jgi:hypothetical protein
VLVTAVFVVSVTAVYGLRSELTRERAECCIGPLAVVHSAVQAGASLRARGNCEARHDKVTVAAGFAARPCTYISGERGTRSVHRT